MDENKFLQELETRAELTREQAFKVAVAVLQELHDRLSVKEADDLAAQLPGEFKARWHAFDLPGREVLRTHKGNFVRHIAAAAEVNDLTASRGLMATFKALQMLLKSPTGREGEAWDIFSQLPKDLKQTWLAAANMAVGKKRTARSSPESRQQSGSNMKCPTCQSDQIDVMDKTVAAERDGWRHHHGQCRQCRAMLWWSAPVGTVDGAPKVGVHQCAFFATPATT